MEKRNSLEKDGESNGTDNRLSYRVSYDEINSHANEKKQSEEKNGSKNIELSKKWRYSIYSLLCFINIVVNMDSGNIPAATTTIADDLNISKQQVGAFGSLVSVGTFVGGIISFSIINLISRKWTLIISLLGVVVCLFTFPLSKNIALLFGNRILVGIFQVSHFIKSLFYKYFHQFGLINFRLKKEKLY